MKIAESAEWSVSVSLLNTDSKRRPEVSLKREDISKQCSRGVQTSQHWECLDVAVEVSQELRSCQSIKGRSRTNNRSCKDSVIVDWDSKG